MQSFETKALPEKYDALAPDGSEIRLLPEMRGGGLAHCTLPPGKTSTATKHKHVDEIWYFLEGMGQVWRKQGDSEETIEVNPKLSLTIPRDTHFQFRNTGRDSLSFIIVTMPPWPGEDESVRVPDHWPLS